MSTTVQPEAPTASPAPREQSLSTFFHVEIMNDLETGQPTLIGSSDASHGDLQVVTADQVIAKAMEQHRLIDKAVRLALAYEAATGNALTGEPRPWTIADSDSGMPLNVTCMSGCNTLHPEKSIGISRATEVNCAQYDTANSMELQIGSGDEEFGGYATLSVEIHSDPVHPDPAKRVPLAAVEVMEDQYIEDLDPNALAIVIDKLQQRVTAMRVRHAELIRIRDEYVRRQA